MKNKKEKIITIGCLSISLIACVLASFVYVKYLYPYGREAKKIAEPLNIEPSWKAIHSYIFESIEPGMTKEEVHAVFDEIGYWEVFFADTEDTKGWHPDFDTYSYREHIRFTEINRRIALREWLFQYDENDILLKYAYSDI